MAKKKEGSVLNTVLIVGAVAGAAYIVSKSMPKLPELPAWLGGGGGTNFAPVISLPSNWTPSSIEMAFAALVPSGI